MQLRELLDEVAAEGAPPNRLTADEVYVRGARRRQVRTATTVAASAVVAGLATALLVVAPTRGPDTAAPGAGPGVYAVFGQDPQHLYALMSPCPGCDREIRGSDDGGRTWTRRDADGASGVPDADPVVTESGAVVMASGTDSAVSTDGFRTFTRVPRSTTPVDAAGEGSTVHVTDFGNSVSIDVIDPARGTYAGLAHQPGLSALAARRGPDGTLWAAGVAGDIGVSPATAGRPAVARSTDGGRNWTIWFLSEDIVEAGATHRPRIHPGPDGRALIEFPGGSGRAFRLAGGVWTELTVGRSDGWTSGPSLVLDDGTYVIQQYREKHGRSAPPFPAPSGSRPAPSGSAGPGGSRGSSGSPGPGNSHAPSGSPGPGNSYPPSGSNSPGTWSSGPNTWSSPAGAPRPSTGASRPGGPWPSRSADVPYPDAGPVDRRLVEVRPGASAGTVVDAPALLASTTLAAIDRMPGGGFIAYNGSSVYVSTDGRTWSRVLG